jgi:Family of unknown function (DUF6452)
MAYGIDVKQHFAAQFRNFACIIMNRINKLTVTAIILSLFAVSCEDNYTICDQSKIVNYKAGFYNKSGTIDVPVTPTTLTLTFPGATTFIYNQQGGISSLILALNPTTDSLRYFIKVNSLPADTITFVYTTGQQTLSPECGDITIHNLTRAWTTTHTLDSVKIVAPSVNNMLKENLKIYY